MSFRKILPAVSALVLVSACTNLAPLYERPEAPVPDTFSTTSTGSPVEAGATLYWSDAIRSPALGKLIDLALQENRDLKVAAANLRIAKAQYGISLSSRYPTVVAGGSATYGASIDTPPSGSSAYRESATAQIGASSYELDFFSRVANLNEAALQSWLSSLEGRRSAEIAIAASVAQIWIQLATDTELLALAEDTVDVQGESLSLTRELFDAGVATELDVRRASASVETARAQAAQFRSQILQDVNALRLVVGANIPSDLIGEASLSPAPVTLTPPVAASSEYLLNRPDILSAEHQLIAANANIGAARAAFFPSITLTGSVSAVSTDLGDLLNSGGSGWSFGPSVSLPIFDYGARKNRLEVARAQQDLAVAQYESTIQSAFRETADALAVADNIGDRLDALQRLQEDTSVTLNLSEQRFRVGVDDYLSVLDSQQQNYNASQSLITARRDQALGAIPGASVPDAE